MGTTLRYKAESFHLAWAVLAVALAFSAPALSQEPLPTDAADDIRAGEVTPALEIVGEKPHNATIAIPERHSVPKYPIQMRYLGQEGWVDLSFVVSKEGKVLDPIVENSSGQPEFERAVLQAAALQRYTPATLDGTPVEQCATRIRYNFIITGEIGGRPELAPTLRKLRKLMDSGKVDTAAESIDALLKKGSWNHYEASRLHLLRYDVCRATGDADCMLDSLKRASAMGGRNLNPSLHREVLERIAALEIDAALFADALATVDQRNNMDPPLPAEHPLNVVVRDIRDQVNGPSTLAFRGRIGHRSGCEVDAPNWRHQLLRREFSIVPEEGKVDKVEIRCDWRRTIDKVGDGNKSWTIPASWGTCHVFVFGDLGATAKLIEYPLVARD